MFSIFFPTSDAALMIVIYMCCDSDLGYYLADGNSICFCMAKLKFQSLFAGFLTSAASQEIKQIDVKFNEQIQNSVLSGERKSRGRLRSRFF